MVNPDQPLPRASPLDDADDACSERISNWITKGIHDSRQTNFAHVVILIVMKVKVVQSRKQCIPIVSNLAANQRHEQHQSRQHISASGFPICAEEDPSILDMALSLSKWSDVSHEMAPANGLSISTDCMHPVKFIGRAYQDSGCAKSHQIAFEIASVCVSSASAADQFATVNAKRLDVDAGSRAKFANVELALLSVLNHANSMHAIVSFTTSAVDSSHIVCGNLAVKYDPRAQPHNIAYLAMARREFLCHMKGRIGSVIVRTFHASANGRPDGTHKRIFAFELLPKNMIRLTTASNSTLNYIDDEGRSIAPEADCEYM